MIAMLLATLEPAIKRAVAPPLTAALLAGCLALLVGCATPANVPRVLLYGEQHDQPDHQRQMAQELRMLAMQGRLGALVLEMAERGYGTASLGPPSSVAEARAALNWNDRAWPWAQYGEVVMAALAAGVPVYGGNLSRADMRTAMADATLDGAVDDGVRRKLMQAVRDGHCGLLPEAQLPAMLRVQIARDRAMAQTVREALAAAPAGRVVVMLSGAQHAARGSGVPLHLRALGIPPESVRSIAFGAAPAELDFDERRPAERTARPDPCAALEETLKAQQPLR